MTVAENKKVSYNTTPSLRRRSGASKSLDPPPEAGAEGELVPPCRPPSSQSMSQSLVERDYPCRAASEAMGTDIGRKGIFHTMRFRKGLAAAPASPQAMLLSPSFETLFLDHWTHVYRLVLGLVGDPAEAEDLALEAFLKLYQRYPEPPEGFNVGGWLTRVAGNLGLRSIRSYKRRQRYELEAGLGVLEDAPENRPAEVQAREEERRLARMGLARMNSHQAQLLILRYSGMTYREIAAAMGLSPNSVGPLLLRAERAFENAYRSLMEEEG